MTSRTSRLIARSLLFAALALVAASACKSKSADRGEAREEARVAPDHVAPGSGSSAAGSASGNTTPGTSGVSSSGLAAGRAQDLRKIVRTGKIELVVGAYDDARAKLDALVAAAGGYIDSTRVEHRRDATDDATIVVRVPQDQFGDLVPKLRRVGNVVSEATNADDITEQYVDVSARLASAQTLEKRLLALVGDRAASLDQVLTVEHELERVRGEIEGYEGHVRQWNDEIALSTLTISLVTQPPMIAAPIAGPPHEATLGERTHLAFASSVAALRVVSSGLLVALTALLPWLVLAVPLALSARKLARRRRGGLPEAVICTPERD